MFTQHDKIKEMAEYLVQNDNNVQCLIFRNKHFAPVGVSEVITCEYSVKDMRIVYNQWFVEGFEYAKRMALPGIEHHGQFVKGSGVIVSTRNCGQFTFYGPAAVSLKSACELNRDLQSYLTQRGK